MEDTKKVSKLEDWLDTGKTVGEILVSGVSILVGVLTICKCSKNLKMKSNNPDQYWSEKNKTELGKTKLVADAINNLAEAIIRS